MQAVTLLQGQIVRHLLKLLRHPLRQHVLQPQAARYASRLSARPFLWTAVSDLVLAERHTACGLKYEY